MIIQSKRIWIASQFIAAQLEIYDGKILAVYPYQTKPCDKDYENDRIIPGFIDVHVHGAYGVDTNDADLEGLIKVLQGLPSEGITSFLPTTVTQGEEVLIKALKNVANVVKLRPQGAEILGVHFEGPYLNVEYKGAQPEEHIVKPDVEQFKRYQQAAQGLIKLITMAVEKDDDHQLTRYLSSHGVVVSMGHSGATYNQAIMGIANGAMSMTHVFNGMSRFSHREPALTGAAMRTRDVYGEIIADGNHVHWAAVNTLMMAKGKDHNIMITDALCTKGCAPGDFELGGHRIEIKANGSAYLYGTDTLAGSTLRYIEGFRNLIEKAEMPFEYAVNACTLNPARMLRVDDRKGRIVAGYDADIVVISDDYHVIQTYCLGKAML
jgi:N-acetylglucosamine-6-phosphate deacetylase